MSERLDLTPSQTVGPYLAIGLDWKDGGKQAVPVGTPGAFWIRGTILDGAGEGIPDALVETWQADPSGKFNHADDPRGAVDTDIIGYTGFGRSSTWNDESSYAIHTVKPGPLPAGDVDDPDGPLEAPHLTVSVFARGMLDRVVTRIYFPDEPLNETDPVLNAVSAERRETLIARREGAGYVHDIRIQGPGETVFFAV